jgi:hypothetical protein
MGLLSNDDERDLIWFCGPGQCAFESSTFGRQLEGAERHAGRTEPCKACRLPEDAATSNGTGFNLETSETCPACAGRGFLVRHAGHNSKRALTARPTGTQYEEPYYEYDENDLLRHASVSRTFGKMSREDVNTLGAYYSDFATWLASEHGKHARIAAVYVLTEPGERRITKCKDPRRGLVELYATTKASGEDGKQARRIDEIARRQYTTAAVAWNEAKGGS